MIPGREAVAEMVTPLVVPPRYGAILRSVPKGSLRQVHRHHMTPFARTPAGDTEVSRCTCGFALLGPPSPDCLPAQPSWLEMLDAADACPQRCALTATVLRHLAGTAFVAA